jgi:signal transduction histidine kinase
LRNALQVENAIDPAIQVRADRIELFRVLANLLRNAAEAGARTICISAKHAGAALTIEIADDGPGLPEPVRAELFHPFAGSTRRDGTGLGLAIARDLMVAHAGSIELIETGTSGTTFRLTLRLAETPDPAEAGQNGPRVAPAAADV